MLFCLKMCLNQWLITAKDLLHELSTLTVMGEEMRNVDQPSHFFFSVWLWTLNCTVKIFILLLAFIDTSKPTLLSSLQLQQQQEYALSARILMSHLYWNTPLLSSLVATHKMTNNKNLKRTRSTESLEKAFKRSRPFHAADSPAYVALYPANS